jgi:hypothetical protein
MKTEDQSAFSITFDGKGSYQEIDESYINHSGFPVTRYGSQQNSHRRSLPDQLVAPNGDAQQGQISDV